MRSLSHRTGLLTLAALIALSLSACSGGSSTKDSGAKADSSSGGGDTASGDLGTTDTATTDTATAADTAEADTSSQADTGMPKPFLGRCNTSRGSRPWSSHSWAWGAISLRAKRRTASWMARRSSESEKSMVASSA